MRHSVALAAFSAFTARPYEARYAMFHWFLEMLIRPHHPHFALGAHSGSSGSGKAVVVVAAAHFFIALGGLPRSCGGAGCARRSGYALEGLHAALESVLLTLKRNHYRAGGGVAVHRYVLEAGSIGNAEVGCQVLERGGELGREVLVFFELEQFHEELAEVLLEGGVVEGLCS